METRRVGGVNDLLAEFQHEIGLRKLRRRAGWTVMMTRFGVHIRRPIISVPVLGMVIVSVTMVVHADSRIGRMRVAMRRDRPGMKTGQDQGHKAKKDNKSAQGMLVSAGRKPWIVGCKVGC